MNRPAPPHEQGLALVNVLLMVALASGLIAAILIAENAGITRGIRLHDAAAADAVLTGGELSAIAALRRDLVQHPEVDDTTEAWLRISDADRKIRGGTFTLQVTDAQAKLNLNALAKGDGPSLTLLPGLVASLKLPPDTGRKMLALFKAVGPISSIAQLGLVGIAPNDVAKLATLCTILPPDVNRINANTASEPMLALLAGDPIVGRLLVTRRARQGFLREGDFIAANARVPAAAGFTSNLYWARGRVTIGDTARERTSLIRRALMGQQAQAQVISRWLGGAAPLDAPALPPAATPVR